MDLESLFRNFAAEVNDVDPQVVKTYKWQCVSLRAEDPRLQPVVG